jgi:hypothetical protein
MGNFLTVSDCRLLEKDLVPWVCAVIERLSELFNKVISKVKKTEKQSMNLYSEYFCIVPHNTWPASQTAA